MDLQKEELTLLPCVIGNSNARYSLIKPTLYAHIAGLLLLLFYSLEINHLMGILTDRPILGKQQQKKVAKTGWELYRGLPFFQWDKPGHTETDLFQGAANCCFNHLVGLPVKHGKQHTLYDYERNFFNTLFQTGSGPKDKHLWCLKAGGLGISELCLRIMAWLSTKDSYYSRAQMAIITAPNLDLAVGLIRRIKAYFPAMQFDSKETTAIINGCEVVAYPSHHLDAMRSLTNLAFILQDEADFYHANEVDNVRAVTERYVPKSDPYIAIVSTPNQPGLMMQRIHQEPRATSMYHKIFLPYTVGLGKIYTKEEIERAKASMSFEREYNLQYGIGIGNIFPYSILVNCIQEYDVRLRDGFKVLAVDPSFGSSKFGIVGVESIDGILYVKQAVQYDRPSPTEMTALLISEAPKWNKNVVVDSFHQGIIRDLQAAGINAESVPFNKELNDMTIRAAEAIKAARVRIHPMYDDLILQLRSVRYNEKGVPDKREISFDLGDSALMAIWYSDLGDISYTQLPNDSESI